MGVDFGLGVGAQIARGKAFQEGGPLGRTGRLIGDAVALQFAGQLVVDHQVELPQLLGAPGGHDFGVDGADVGPGEQGEALEAFHGFDAAGHVADGGGIENIARLQDGGKLQVGGDEKQHHVAAGARDPNARHGLAGQAQGTVHVAFVGRALAGIVKQKGEQQQAGLFHFVEQAGEGSLAGRRGAAQVPQVLHGHQGVLVDGVAVEEIADDQAVDLPQLGKDGGQQAGIVHGAHGHGRLRQRQNAFHQRPERLRIGEELAQAGAAGRELAFGLERRADAVAGGEFEEAERELGIGVQLLGGAEVSALAVDAEVGIAQAGAPIAELGEEGTGLGFGAFESARGGAVDGAGVPVILAHPAGGVAAGIRLPLFGDGLLGVEREEV